jgi:hypothetical protein
MLKANSVVPIVAALAAGISSLSAQQPDKRPVLIRPAAPPANALARDWPFVQGQSMNISAFSSLVLQAGADHPRAAGTDRLYWMLVNEGFACRGNGIADCSTPHGRDLLPVTWTPGTGASGSYLNGPDSPAAAPVTTPEPITLLLLGSGLAGIGAVARRGRMNQKQQE